MSLNEHPNHDEASISLRVVLLTFVVVLVGALGYLVMAQNRAADTTDNSSAVVTPKTETTTTETTTDETGSTTSSSYLTYTSTAFSYEYPKTAEIPDRNSAIFVYGGLNYSVETPSPAGKTSIESWIKDANVSATATDLTKYTKVMLAGETAYTYTGELRTYVMHDGVVYVIVARDSIAPSTKTTDATYAHQLASFKFTR